MNTAPRVQLLPRDKLLQLRRIDRRLHMSPAAPLLHHRPMPCLRPKRQLNYSSGDECRGECSRNSAFLRHLLGPPAIRQWQRRADSCGASITAPSINLRSMEGGLSSFQKIRADFLESLTRCSRHVLCGFVYATPCATLVLALLSLKSYPPAW